MKNRQRFTLFVLLLPLSIIAQNPATLQLRLDSLLTAAGYPGVTCAVVTEDGTVYDYASGYADVENEIKMKPGDRMFSGSTGKTFVSAIAMQLIDEDKLDPEDLVYPYFEGNEWFTRIPNHATMKVRHLLNHTSGLPRYAFKPGFWEEFNKDRMRSFKPEEILAYVLDDEPVHAAGEGWGYSDTGYIVLGMIIEKICNDSYYSQLEKRILKPYKLHGISPSLSREFDRLVPGYTGENVPPFNLPGKTVVDGKYIFNPQFEWTGGGLVTSAADNARWIKMLYEGKVFSEESLKALTSPVDFRTGQPAEFGYGYGVFVYRLPQGKALGHSGFFFGYETVMLYFPETKTAIAVQTNNDQTAGKMKMPLMQFVVELVSPRAKGQRPK